MARNKETALKYSSIPCDILRDKSVQRAVRCASRDGRAGNFTSILILVIIYLQITIHGSKTGYYAEYTDEFVDDFAFETNLLEEDIKAAIEYSARAQVIDAELFEKQKIISSVGIQHAYFSAMARGRRQCPLETPYLLVDLEDYSFAGKNTETNRLSSEEKRYSSEDTKQSSEGEETSSGETELTTEVKGKTAEETCESSEEKGVLSESIVGNNKSNDNIMYLTLAERKDIELFFHSEKGLRAWADITDDIVRRMDPVGWLDGARRPIHDKTKYAMAWTVRDEFAKRGSIFQDDGAREAYQELYQVLASLPERHLLTQISYVQLVAKQLVLRVMSDDVINFVDGHIAQYKKTVKLFNQISYEKQKHN